MAYYLEAHDLVQRAVAEEEGVFHSVQGLLSLQNVSACRTPLGVLGVIPQLGHPHQHIDTHV